MSTSTVPPREESDVVTADRPEVVGDLTSLSIRELIAYLAETEAALREPSSAASRRSIVREQARVARELRRRRGRTAPPRMMTG